VTDSAHPPNGRLEGYCKGLVPWVSWVIGYDPLNWIRPVPSSGKMAGKSYTLYQVHPHHSWLERRGHPSRRN
jgi:hypothetical protein